MVQSRNIVFGDFEVLAESLAPFGGWGGGRWSSSSRLEQGLVAGIENFLCYFCWIRDVSAVFGGPGAYPCIDSSPKLLPRDLAQSVGGNMLGSAVFGALYQCTRWGCIGDKDGGMGGHGGFFHRRYGLRTQS